MSGKKLFKLKKIDILIVVILLVSSGIVLFKAGYIYQPSEEKIPPSEREKQTQIEESPEKPLIPPASITPGYMRAVSPGDEGLHYDKINVCREWWYFTVVFDKNSELPGWVATVSFNHMARGDLLGTAKPDLLVVALHGPNGEEYGGMINKERGLGILKQPTLQAKTPGVSVTYDNSWAEGEAPEWVVHAEDEDIEGFWPLSLDIDIDDYFVYIMANMYFFQCFVSFYAYFQNIVFVNQPYVEVYKKAMRSQEGIIQNTPAVFWRDMPEILKQNPSFDSKKFIEVVLYFYPKEGFIEELTRTLSHQFPHKKSLVFIGSDWNHHSYQAAFKSEDTLYVIACLEEYENCPYIDKNIIQENVNTLKVISSATFSTLKDKA